VGLYVGKWEDGLERDVTGRSCGLVQGSGTITVEVGRTFASVRMVDVKIGI
jgi:hypothetical protein